MITQTRIQVLLITGILTSEHNPENNLLLRRMLESTGRFKVKITEEFRGATAETLADYDLVLINYDGKETVHDPAVRLGEQSEQVLLDFVRSGKGIIFYHSSVFREVWPNDEFVKMMGICFDFKNGSRKALFDDMKVKITAADHPITANLDKTSWYTVQEDLFTPACSLPDAKVEILATVFDDINEYQKVPAHMANDYSLDNIKNFKGINTEQPVAWVNSYGEGRVFVITIGHASESIKRPGFVALFCRGAEWAATGQVTIPPPNLSGENRFKSWPYYS